MAAPTSIACSVDSVEYSRYEDDNHTITATVVATGGAPYSTEEVVVTLRKARRNRDAIIATSTLSLAGGADPRELTATFPLKDIVDQDLINLARSGQYFVHAEYAAVSASAEIGGGLVVIEAASPGTDGNAYSVEVVVPGGTSPLSVALVGFVLTISLETVGGVAEAGMVNNSAMISSVINTAQLDLVASYTDAGSGVINAAEGPTQLTGGTETVEGESADFWIEIMTVNRFKRDYLFGLDLRATEVKSVKIQPQAITGIEITEINKSHPEGFGMLTYNTYVDGANTIRALSWNGGPVQHINGPGTYLLQSGTSGVPFALPSLQAPNYISVKVRSHILLPSSPVTESLLVEKVKMEDSTLRKMLHRSQAWLENDELHVYLEPTNAVTEPDPTSIDWSAGINTTSPILTDSDYDVIVSPLTHFIPAGGYSGWVWIQSAFNSILRVDTLYGAIANTRVIDIDLEWIEHSIQGGFIQLLPYNQETSFDFLGLMTVNSMRGGRELPNFWHFNMIVGLRECTADIQDVLGKKAAIDALTIAGQAFRPGVGSISLGRDGVSESVSYTNTAQFGLYNGVIQNYREQIQDQIKKLRARYKGLNMVVV